MTSTQLQFPEPVHGVVDPAAGEAAKEAGMAQAAAHTPDDWATQCDRAIEDLAACGEPFQAADLVIQGLVGEPPHPAMWGPRFGAAARRGVIRDAGAVPSKRATVHKSLCRQWIGVGEVAA